MWRDVSPRLTEVRRNGEFVGICDKISTRGTCSLGNTTRLRREPRRASPLYSELCSKLCHNTDEICILRVCCRFRACDERNSHFKASLLSSRRDLQSTNAGIMSKLDAPKFVIALFSFKGKNNDEVRKSATFYRTMSI